MLSYNMQDILKHMMHFYVIKGTKDHWILASSTGYVFAKQSYAPKLNSYKTHFKRKLFSVDKTI